MNQEWASGDLVGPPSGATRGNPAVEARFRAMIEATPDCVKVVTPEGILLEINDAGIEMIEAAGTEEVVGRPVFGLIATEDREAFREFNRRICLGERLELSFDIIGLKGTRRRLQSHSVPMPGVAGGTLHLSVTRDITERGRYEADRDLLAAIIESSDDIIVSKTLDGIITSWNRGAEQILQYRADEVVGRHVSMLMPEDVIEDTEKILGRIRRGEKVDHYETRRRRKDGAIIDVSLTVSPVRDGSGKIIGASKVGRDVTEQKRVAVILREADRRKDEFLAMLAHELRNPLSAIANAVTVARKSELDEPLTWSTQVIERQVHQLARLVDDLLDVSRISRGKVELRREPVDVGPVLHAALETARPLVEGRKHQVSLSTGPGPLRVLGDPVRLEQVAVNLLTNAAKYTESGGRIWVTAESDGPEVVLRFRDNGVGIPPEKLPEMFELFAQGDRSLARSEGGLGIGLTLVKSLVEMHGGSIAASSEGRGAGCEFVVRLPAAAGAPVDRPGPSPAREGRPAARRVLIVDDNHDSARGLARYLKLMGHEVRTAHDGPGAIEAAGSFRPEVVLLDIGLPGIDGYEVARRLRAAEARPGTLLIAVSGYGQEEDRRRGREAGFDHHLVKPVDPDGLLALFRAS